MLRLSPKALRSKMRGHSRSDLSEGVPRPIGSAVVSASANQRCLVKNAVQSLSWRTDVFELDAATDGHVCFILAEEARAERAAQLPPAARTSCELRTLEQTRAHARFVAR
eukprot:2715166-Pleurochrysis_carterae.AAC.2